MYLPKITKRVGAHLRGCSGKIACPDCFELDNGDYALIGTDITGQISLPDDAGCSSEERVVVVPRSLLLSVAQEVISKK